MFGNSSNTSTDKGNTAIQMTSYHAIDDLESGKLVESTKRPSSNTTILQLIKPYFWPAHDAIGAKLTKVRAIMTWVVVFSSKICSVLAPFYLIHATNQLQATNIDQSIIVWNIVIYCALKVSASMLKECQGMIYVHVKQQANIELQTNIFKHIHSLSLNWYLSKHTGAVIKSMDRGCDAIDNLVTYLFLMLIPALFECFAVIIIFIQQYHQWTIGATILIGITLYILITIYITRIRRNLRDKTNKHDNDYHNKANDSIINFETIKYFTAEEYELNHFHQSIVKYQNSATSIRNTNNMLNISQQVVLYATLLISMVLATISVINKDLTIGEWVAVQSWIVTIFAPLNFLGGIYSGIIQSLIDIKNLMELLNEEPDVYDEVDATDLPRTMKEEDDKGVDNHMSYQGGVITPLPQSAAIHFNNISFHYPSQAPTQGLKNVSFTIPSGKTVAIVGSTGSGKTTISRLLFRFYDPLDGNIAINGYDIRKYKQSSVRKMIGIVPQDTVLFHDTIRYNIQYGNQSATQQQLEDAANAAQILTFIQSLPEQWDTIVGERGLKLSGGEKQRVAIARCLLKNPPIVVLDEATSALDTVTENSIQSALYNLGRHRTVLIIAHRLSTIKYADKIVVMDKGKIVESGTHDELLPINGHYANLWNMQLQSNNSH